MNSGNEFINSCDEKTPCHLYAVYCRFHKVKYWYLKDSPWNDKLGVCLKMNETIKIYHIENVLLLPRQSWPVDALLKRPALRWRHNGLDSVRNHQLHDCLLNRSFGHRSKKTSKLRVTGLCVGNSPVTGEFPAQMASNAENVSIWWRHHE